MCPVNRRPRNIDTNCKYCWCLNAVNFGLWVTRELQHGWSLESATQNTSRTRLPVFIGFMFLSAFSFKSLYWLLALNGSAPVYLSSYFTRIADVPSRLRLRSSTSEQLIVPLFNLTTVGKRAFPVSAANLWNSLPAHLISAPSLAIFWQRLDFISGAPTQTNSLTLRTHILLWT